MGLKLPAIIDTEIFNRPGKEYFPALCEKHMADHDDGKMGHYDKEFKAVRKTQTIIKYFSNADEPV